LKVLKLLRGQYSLVIAYFLGGGGAGVKVWFRGRFLKQERWERCMEPCENCCLGPSTGGTRSG